MKISILAMVAALAPATASAQTVITYYHVDAVGSPVAATGQAGNLLWSEAYTPFGRRLVDAASAPDNGPWYTGHVEDEDTGLLYAEARYYAADVGRLMAIDPAPVRVGNVHSFSRYTYANNNPFKYVDPDGAEPVGAVRVMSDSGPEGLHSVVQLDTPEGSTVIEFGPTTERATMHAVPNSMGRMEIYRLDLETEAELEAVRALMQKHVAIERGPYDLLNNHCRSFTRTFTTEVERDVRRLGQINRANVAKQSDQAFAYARARMAESHTLPVWREFAGAVGTVLFGLPTAVQTGLPSRPITVTRGRGRYRK